MGGKSFPLLHGSAHGRLGRVEIRRRAGCDGAQLVQHLDLLADDTTHLARRSLGFAGQLDEPTMQL
ncbi:MAG: hypothetical protein ACHQAQ_02130, partial [Hyphomicrobiales bacterium]